MTVARASELQAAIRRQADSKKARILQRFFKTGPGEYGEGDRFLGLTVPVLRKFSKEHRDLGFNELQRLINSAFHEERLLSLLVLVLQYPKASDRDKEKIYRFYVKNMSRINSWDLVDLSAEHVVGAYLLQRKKEPLYVWAKSKNLWKRRIAVLATFHYIKRGRFSETLRLSKMLLHDPHDLIHKAVGWMLREIGKRDLAAEEAFLMRHYNVMPRTMLRYAIERFAESKRQAYLRGQVPKSPG